MCAGCSPGAPGCPRGSCPHRTTTPPLAGRRCARNCAQICVKTGTTGDPRQGVENGETHLSSSAAGQFKIKRDVRSSSAEVSCFRTFFDIVDNGAASAMSTAVPRLNLPRAKSTKLMALPGARGPQLWAGAY